MEFKLLVVVFCLASIKVSEAALSLTPATVTASVSECASSGDIISYTTVAAGATNAPVTYVLTSQVPDSTTKKFAVASADGALTAVVSAASTFHSTTQISYVLTITASDSTPTAETDTVVITVSVTPGSCSSADRVVIPTVAVLLFALFSVLMKSNN